MADRVNRLGRNPSSAGEVRRTQRLDIVVERIGLVSRRFVISGIAAAAIAGAVVPSFASTGPVTITRDNGSTTVGVHEGNTPVAGATVYNDGAVCGGIGEQVPVCTPPVGDAIGPIGATRSTQSLPVTVRHDDNGTAVGVGDVGVIVYPNGDVCPVVSTDNIRCIHTPAG